MSASINNRRGLRPRKYSKRWWKAHMRGVREYWERYGRSRRTHADSFDIAAARAFLDEMEASERRLALWEKAFLAALCIAVFLSLRGAP